jgi:hypothetical protein
MVEINIEDGGTAMVPDFFGDGKVEENHALCGLAGTDHGVAEERFGCQGFEFRESGVDVVEILLLDGAGCDLFAFGCGESGGEVLEEEREMEPVVDAKSGKDVEMIFGMLIGDDDGVGLEDSVGGIDGGAGDGEICCPVRSEAENKSENYTENEERQKNRYQQVASGGLGELKLRHWQEHSKGEAFQEGVNARDILIKKETKTPRSGAGKR